MEINKKLTPYNFTALKSKKNEFIVIHYVGAESTAKNNADYFYNNRLQASAHYFVDENEIWQVVEDKNAAWHCGGGLQGSNGHKYYGICKNANSIGIEMCCYKDSTGNWRFKEGTVSNTVKLVQDLMKKYEISEAKVIRHYDVTGKNCPAMLVDEGNWSEFKKRIMENNVTDYSSPNDIVWELAYRGIVTDKEGMLREISENPNGRLYWLARKTVEFIRDNI